MAGSVLLYSTTLKNLNPLSDELKPSPVVPIPIFSTKIFSPAINCGVANPFIGVFNVHVTIPLLLLWIFVTRYPLVLLIVLNICGLEVKPLGDSKMLTVEIEFAVNFNSMTPWSLVSFPVSGSTITNSGTEVWFTPPSVIWISVIESELISVIVGDNLASGRNVLSEW